ncbi:MAG: hypothetical protein ACYTG0_22305, partial [Planctomycetota bacterium]
MPGRNRTSRVSRLGVVVLFTLALVASRGKASEEPLHPLKPADTSSPRATLKSFLDACDEIHEVIQRQERGMMRTESRYRNIA